MRRMIAAVAIAVSAACATGCAGQGTPGPGSSDPPPSPAMSQVCTKDGPVVFAVAGRQNSPAPVLTGSMHAAAATAVSEGSAIGLVDLDGRPRLILAGAFSDPGANPLALQAAQQHFLGSIATAVEQTRAASPHADMLDALNVAGHAIRAACSYGGTIYLEDSGLQETGLVNFHQAGMLSAAPASVVSYLTRLHDLPHLAGMTVVLVGLGNTAPPQLPLSISQQNNVTAIWSAIAKAGGAVSVQVDPAPLSGAAPVHVPPVSPVPIPPVPVPHISGAEVTPIAGGMNYTLSDRLRDFAVNSAALTSVAEAALVRIAADIKARPPAEITCTGSTDGTGTAAFDQNLSVERAATVCDYLAGQGISPRLLHPIGAGKATPSAANPNLRRVIITATWSAHAAG
jgi:OmpA-OmpF porin, OOP family